MWHLVVLRYNAQSEYLPILSARSATLSNDVGKSRRRQKHDTFASTFPDGV